jgi:hypothetical protein
MGVLNELGLAGGEAGLMLIEPPDSVLAEAGQMKPRPSIASSLQVAEPAARIAWWAERSMLTPALLSRLHWMISTAGGEGWIVFEPADEAELSCAGVRAAIEGSPLAALGETVLTTGDIAIRVGPA